MMGRPVIPCRSGPPRCPATTRHTKRYGVDIGLQCHYEPGHDGDHAAHTEPGQSDIFWPQEPLEVRSEEDDEPA